MGIKEGGAVLVESLEVLLIQLWLSVNHVRHI